MKTIKYISALFLAMVGVTACVYDAPEVDSVLLPEDNEAWQPTISIKELIDAYKLSRFLDSPKDYGKPWYGQLMAGPQMIAYLLQVNYWLEKYQITLDLS